jgi:NADH-quinone oxidoreductase subunit L
MVMILPLVILAIGAISSGYLFKELFIGHESSYSFWKNSIKFLEPLNTNHPPTWLMLSTPILVISSIPIAYYLFIKNKTILEELIKNNNPLYKFLLNKWYFDELYNLIFVKFSKNIGLFFWKKIDVGIIDRFGPDGISGLIKNLSIRAVKFQSGLIYQYAFVMLLGFAILLTLLIFK